MNKALFNPFRLYTTTDNIIVSSPYTIESREKFSEYYSLDLDNKIMNIKAENLTCIFGTSANGWSLNMGNHNIIKITYLVHSKLNNLRLGKHCTIYLDGGELETNSLEVDNYTNKIQFNKYGKIIIMNNNFVKMWRLCNL